MKKFMNVLAIAAMVMSVATVKAQTIVENDSIHHNEVAMAEVKKADTINYKIRLRVREMSKVMRLEVDQIENLQFTNSDLTRRVARLAKAPAAQRQALLTVIVSENLAAVHEVLDANQYRQYLSFLNNEFNKAGLNTILFNEGMLAEK
jgi:1-deoxy-D-xylulose 5-phosphate reductoisomerase